VQNTSKSDKVEKGLRGIVEEPLWVIISETETTNEWPIEEAHAFVSKLRGWS
jgi:hypothetical protein